MSAENVEQARRIYEARNRGDIDAVLTECDSAVEWHPHLASLGGRPVKGHGVRKYMASLKEDWETFRHEPLEFFDAGDKVVVFLDTHATGRESGIDVLVPVAHVLSFENGKCLGYVSHHDRDQAMRSVGLEPKSSSAAEQRASGEQQ